MKSTFLTLFLIVTFSLAMAQSKGAYVDSLRIELNRKPAGSLSDSVKYDILHAISLHSKDPKEKITYAQLAFEHAKISNNKAWMASACFLEAYGQSLIGDTKGAIELLYQSKELYSAIGSKEGEAVCLGELARLHKRNSDYHSSEKTYNEAIQLLQSLQDTIKISAAYLNLGELYRETKRFNKALYYFHIAESLYQSIPYPYGVAYAKGNAGLAYVGLNKPDSAKSNLNSSIGILKPLNDNYALSSYLDGLAQMYLHHEAYDSAQIMAQKSLDLALQYGLKEQVRDASLRLSDIYSRLNDYKSAYAFHKQYIAYDDSINNEQNIRDIANLRVGYEVSQKQKEIDVQKVQAKRYLTIAVALISVMTLLIVLVIVMLKNNKDRNIANRKLQAQHDELELANATKNRFFSILSHDLRSPLANFYSYAKTVEMLIEDNETETLKEVSSELRSASYNLLSLLDNLLQWGINQMKANRYVPKEVNLKQVVEMELGHLKNISTNKHITVETVIPQDITLFVDEVSISVAIRNLISNAFKFTSSGGTIRINASQQNGQTVFAVADTGIGMSLQQKQKLFDFNQIDSTYGTQNEKGVGLGLQLVHEFIKKSGAAIVVKSSAGHGTTFIITFPAR
ncbi:Signal transduction histidine kinase [Saccharicrinis carchari]|uniref:histidine kinase n=1 Tax=Saccharicrinis carchari TaxID=1168039 RepID=A0A521DPU6_SACCC|nr:tetratricopeptide repeat-containing sensor histidine kinase [Saccharicrinis carchari]SMO73131.1 Signal transduction histidine kinase [Saccharicrinis carchari]